MLMMRFDLRDPVGGSPAPERYRAAVEMARFADRNGFGAVAVSEHHACDDGYLPSPLTFAGAIAAVTETVGIMIAAVVLPLHDPVRIAEDIVVLDLVSNGRVGYIMGAGYRPEEFAMFGVRLNERGRLLEEYVGVLKRCWTGEPFEWRGRRIHVTPTPQTEPHPMLFLGGGSEPAARRAARLGLPLLPQAPDPRLDEWYADEAVKAGTTDAGGFVIQPSGPSSVWVDEDPDRAWAAIGHHLLAEMQAYARWQDDGVRTHAHVDGAQTVDDVRNSGVSAIVTPDECVDLLHQHGSVPLMPLVGGVDPDRTWAMLELVRDRVVPKLAP